MSARSASLNPSKTEPTVLLKYRVFFRAMLAIPTHIVGCSEDFHDNDSPSLDVAFASLIYRSACAVRWREYSGA